MNAKPHILIENLTFWIPFHGPCLTIDASKYDFSIVNCEFLQPSNIGRFIFTFAAGPAILVEGL